MNINAIKLASKTRFNVYLHRAVSLSCSIVVFVIVFSVLLLAPQELTTLDRQVLSVFLLLSAFCCAFIVGVSMIVPVLSANSSYEVIVLTRESKAAKWYVDKALNAKKMLTLQDMFIAEKLWQRAYENVKA